MPNWIFQNPIGNLLIRCCHQKCQDPIFTLNAEYHIVLAQIIDNIWF